ncbi:MAG TPA: peptidyl-prolyl cis-trans isomerase [Verrucomicrobiae bacterium]|nr:peptidyl-prolyl cis-trans isomerase [Verrucomicrobiae bacterium]
MFNLFRTEKSKRIVMGAILLVVSAGMLLYLVPNYQTGQISADTTVAKVGDQEITINDVRRQVQDLMKGRQMPAEIIPNYIPRLVEGMISERALEYEARRLGFQVTDQDVANFIRTQLPPELFPNGQFNKEMYAMVLEQEKGQTIEEYEAGVRRKILITRLLDVAVEGTVVSEPEIETTYRVRNEKIKMQWVKFDRDKFSKEITTTPDEERAYYKANSGRFIIPPKMSLAVLYLDPVKLEDTMNPPDADLQALYKQNIDQFRVPERVKVGEILFMTQGKPADQDAKAKAQADDVLKQVKSGANFADLVKKYSEDTGNKNGKAFNDATLGPGEYWVHKDGQFVKEFETAAFSMKPGDSAVVKTQFGYHVMKVFDHQDARLKPFEEVKADLAKQWKTNRANQIQANVQDKAEAALKADPSHPDKVAADLNMQVLRIDDYQPDQPLGDLGVSPDFERSAADLKAVGDVSQPVALASNKVALAVVTAIAPSRPKTFEESEKEIHNAMVAVRVGPAMLKRAQELYDKAKDMGGDLEKAAKSMGLEVKTSEPFDRQGSVKDLPGETGAQFMQGFTLPVGSLFGPIQMASSTVVAKVIEKMPADMSKMAAQRSSIRDEIKRKHASDRDNLFEAGVMSTLEREGKLKQNKDAIERLIASYRAG